MTKLTCIVLVLLFAVYGCKDHQAPKREIHNDLFDWSITIPEGYDTISAAQAARMQDKGAQAIEKTFNEKVEGRANTVFMLSSGPTNYFESNYQSFDTATDGNYAASCKNVYGIIYQTFISQLPNIIIDSAMRTEQIDDLTFQTCDIVMRLPNDKVIHSLMYNRLFGTKDLTVSITYADEKKGKALLEAWKNSKFGKHE